MRILCHEKEQKIVLCKPLTTPLKTAKIFTRTGQLTGEEGQRRPENRRGRNYETKEITGCRTGRSACAAA
jgi:hypothetical protein